MAPYRVASSTGPAQTSCRYGGAMRATGQARRKIDADQRPEKKGSGGKAKAYQVQQLLKAIDRLETERAAVQRAEIPNQEATVKRKKKG